MLLSVGAVRLKGLAASCMDGVLINLDPNYGFIIVRRFVTFVAAKSSLSGLDSAYQHTTLKEVEWRPELLEIGSYFGFKSSVPWC